MFHSPIELWNLKAQSHLARAEAMLDSEITFVQYEDILRDPVRIIAWLGRRLCLQWSKPACFSMVQSSTNRKEMSRFGRRNPARSVTRATDNLRPDGDKFVFRDYQDFYLRSGWREAILPRDLDFIDSQLDRSVMRSLGYSYGNPSRRLTPPGR